MYELQRFGRLCNTCGVVSGSTRIARPELSVDTTSTCAKMRIFRVLGTFIALCWHLIQTGSDDQIDSGYRLGPRRPGRNTPEGLRPSGPNSPLTNENVASLIPLPPPSKSKKLFPEPPDSPRVASSLIGAMVIASRIEISCPDSIPSCQAAGGRIEFRGMVRHRNRRLGNSVTVAQLTLDQLVMVQIHVPQLYLKPFLTMS